VAAKEKDLRKSTNFELFNKAPEIDISLPEKESNVDMHDLKEVTYNR